MVTKNTTCWREEENNKRTILHWLVIRNMQFTVPGSCVCLNEHICVSVCVCKCHYACTCVCPKPEATRPAATITVTDVKELGRHCRRSDPGMTRPARALNQYRTQPHTHTRLYVTNIYIESKWHICITQKNKNIYHTAKKSASRKQLKYLLDIFFWANRKLNQPKLL